MRRKGESVFAASFFWGVCFLNDELNIPARQNGKLVTSEHTNPAGWPRGTEPLCPFVTLSEAGVE